MTTEIALAQPTAPAVAEAVSETLFAVPQADSQPSMEVGDWIPDKFKVRGADGKLDLDASGKKFTQSYNHAVQRIGKPEGAPDSASAYTLTVPEGLDLDVELSETAFAPFMEKAHAAGFSQAQLDVVTTAFFEMLPALTSDAVAIKVEQARAELAQAWPEPENLKLNMQYAERAVSAMPPDLQDDIRAHFGTNPTFWRFAAHFGKEVGEDRPAAPAGGAQGATHWKDLMRTEAYRNPKHADHQRVSHMVRQAVEKEVGTATVIDGFTA